MICTYCKHKFKWEMDGNYMSEKGMEAYPHHNKSWIERVFAFDLNQKHFKENPYRSRPQLPGFGKLWLKGDTATINKLQALIFLNYYDFESKYSFSLRSMTKTSLMFIFMPLICVLFETLSKTIKITTWIFEEIFEPIL